MRGSETEGGGRGAGMGRIWVVVEGGVVVGGGARGKSGGCVAAAAAVAGRRADIVLDGLLLNLKMK